MTEQINRILNIIMGSFAGVFLGRVIYVYWSYKTHPDLYAMRSAPWYADILSYGLASLAVLALCLLIKGILWLCNQKSRRDKAEKQMPQ